VTEREQSVNGIAKEKDRSLFILFSPRRIHL
jgi:hypothetical protein